jgi:hypothetical protein
LAAWSVGRWHSPFQEPKEGVPTSLYPIAYAYLSGHSSLDI